MGNELKTHKDLDAWKRSLDLVEMVYKVTNAFPQEELYGLPRGICEIDVIPWGRRNQLRRAAVSIPSNIAEGAARGSKKEFIQFLHVVYPVKYMIKWLFHGAGDLCPKLRHSLSSPAPCNDGKTDYLTGPIDWDT